MATPEGFTFKERKDGTIVIFHHGRVATVLRGRKATDFTSDLAGDDADAQELMARLTGNYKRGNERTAATHPRNRT